MHAHACACTRVHSGSHTRARTHPQFTCKTYSLGYYEVEVDAAAARDMVAKVLGSRLNFTKSRKVTGQRSEGADQAVADAVKAANATACQVRGDKSTADAKVACTDCHKHSA